MAMHVKHEETNQNVSVTLCAIHNICLETKKMSPLSPKLSPFYCKMSPAGIGDRGDTMPILGIVSPLQSPGRSGAQVQCKKVLPNA